MIDWKTIETEYVTTDISHRQLAEKYGICRSTICKKAADDKWSEKRKKHRDKTVSKAVNAVGKTQAEQTAKLFAVGGLVLDKVKSLIEENPELLADTSAMKDVSVVLKNLKDLLMVKSEDDKREQQARIDKLRKEAMADEGDKQQTVTVIMGDGADKYAD